MKKFKISALLLTAVLALTPVFGCSGETSEPEISLEGTGYAALPDVGKEKVNVSMNEDTDINETPYKLNRVIDSGRIQDGQKYIYLDVTIKNTSDKTMELSGLKNFYLVLSDETEVLPDIRADIYAKRAMTGYQQLLSIDAGSEFTGYIGFLVDQNVNSFTVGFFPTGKDDDRTNVILCDVKESDIVAAPDGMFTA